MTNIQSFIEDAIKGGWKYEKELFGQTTEGFKEMISKAAILDYLEQFIDSILLMPSAWQAVGKTRGWKKDHWDGEIKNYDGGGICRETIRIVYEPYQFKRHQFLKLIDEGKDIEDALKEIK